MAALGEEWGGGGGGSAGLRSFFLTARTTLSSLTYTLFGYVHF